MQKQYDFYMVESEILVFKDNHTGRKARKLNLRYENENNADMDNGVLNKHADQERVAGRAGLPEDKGGNFGAYGEMARSMRSSLGSGSTTNAVSPSRFDKA